MAADLFKQKQSYDNEGNLYTNSATAFLKAQLTIVPRGTATPVVPNMYDGDSTSGCLIMTAFTGTATVVWKFTGKPKFKNVFATMKHEGGDSRTMYIHGSNDGSAYTQLATIAATSTDATETMTAADVNWKYIKVSATTAGNSTTVYVADIMGTT